MSVIVTVLVKGDPKGLEEYASNHPDQMRAIADAAKQRGLIAHRFYGSDEGEVLVIDEWPEPSDFQGFFQDQQGPIGSMMQEAGAMSEPDVKFWHKLETHDEVGWE